jgi:hypothetical protein
LPSSKEILEGFASLETDYFRYGAAVNLPYTLYEATQGTKNADDVGAAASRMAGSYLAGFLRVLKPAKDALSQFTDEESKMRDFSDSAGQQFVKEISRTLPFVGQTAPAQKDALTGEDIKAIAPLARMVGVNIVHPSFLSAKQSPATEWAEKVFVFVPSGEWTPEQQKAFRIRKRLRQAVYRGEVAPKDLTKKIREFVKSGQLTERSADTFEKDIKLSELQYRLKYGYKPGTGNSIMDRKLEKVMNAATPEELADIEEIIGKRIKKAKKGR